MGRFTLKSGVAMVTAAQGPPQQVSVMKRNDAGVAALPKGTLCCVASARLCLMLGGESSGSVVRHETGYLLAADRISGGDEREGGFCLHGGGRVAARPVAGWCLVCRLRR